MVQNCTVNCISDTNVLFQRIIRPITAIGFLCIQTQYASHMVPYENTDHHPTTYHTVLTPPPNANQLLQFLFICLQKINALYMMYDHLSPAEKKRFLTQAVTWSAAIVISIVAGNYTKLLATLRKNIGIAALTSAAVVSGTYTVSNIVSNTIMQRIQKEEFVYKWRTNISSECQKELSTPLCPTYLAHLQKALARPLQQSSAQQPLQELEILKIKTMLKHIITHESNTPLPQQIKLSLDAHNAA